ncbi:MAG: sodium:solute symporter family protein [Vampirovibrionales bacterium]|nr:sodium:solute symporter family protein [Vampirovibrionales bacterium]
MLATFQAVPVAAIAPWFVGLMVFYFLCVLFLAHSLSRKIAGLKDFFLAGRSLGPWPVAVAFVSSWFGAGSTMGSINAFNQEGLGGLWYIFIPSGITCLLITLFLAKRVARRSEMSQPEAVRKYYGPLGRALLSVIIIISITNFVASQLVAAGLIFDRILDVGMLPATLICISVVLAYSVVGGYFAVVVTDFAQLSMVVLGLLTLLIACLAGFGDSQTVLGFFFARPQSFWQLIQPAQASIAHSQSPSLLEHLSLTLSFVLAWCLAPEMWQRMTSSKNERYASKAAWLAVLILFLLFGIVTAIGLVSSYYLPQSEALPNKQVLVDLALLLPHPLLTSLVLMGFLAAVTSTMDSSLNVGSLTLTHDLYQGFIRPSATERELVWVGRLGLVLMAIPAIIIAVAFQDIIHVLWMSADVFASAMVVPVMGILFFAQPKRLSGVLAMVFGLGFSILSMAFQYHWFALDSLLPFLWPQAPYSTLVGVSVSLLGFTLGQWLSPHKT